MERVIANLVDNAERHGHGLVRLGILCGSGQARIEVDDAGPGVPAADRERIFERFARGSPPTETPVTAVSASASR